MVYIVCIFDIHENKVVIIVMILLVCHTIHIQIVEFKIYPCLSIYRKCINSKIYFILSFKMYLQHTKRCLPKNVMVLIQCFIAKQRQKISLNL